MSVKACLPLAEKQNNTSVILPNVNIRGGLTFIRTVHQFCREAGSILLLSGWGDNEGSKEDRQTGRKWRERRQTRGATGGRLVPFPRNSHSASVSPSARSSEFPSMRASTSLQIPTVSPSYPWVLHPGIQPTEDRISVNAESADTEAWLYYAIFSMWSEQPDFGISVCVCVCVCVCFPGTNTLWIPRDDCLW